MLTSCPSLTNNSRGVKEDTKAPKRKAHLHTELPRKILTQNSVHQNQKTVFQKVFKDPREEWMLKMYTSDINDGGSGAWVPGNKRGKFHLPN